ncbi:MAG: LutC/YkgG family protein [Pirellulaceae bacterium]
MESKQEILATLRRGYVPPVELPSLDGPWLTFARPRDQFCQILAAVGGQSLVVPTAATLEQALAALPLFRAARNVWSLVPPVPSTGQDWTTVKDPHDLESLDFCVAPGEFGVAENGAVWVAHHAVPHRAALFIAQHLVLVVPAHEIVHNMRDAYARLKPGDVPFGIFISGPSKTADIEQSLVIGAHGARSLTVVLVGPEQE